MTIPYQDSSDNESILRYSPYSPKNKARQPVQIVNEELLQRFSKHNIPCENSFVPAKLEIREQSSSGYKGDMRRLVVLSEDKLHYKVYSIPASASTKDRDVDIPMS